jgi:enoyl-CoA hydratase/carnithine racemase
MRRKPISTDTRISRSAAHRVGVLTVRFDSEGKEHTFTGTTHHDFPRLIEDIAYDRDNKVLVLTATGETFINNIDGPSLGDLTKPWTADVLYLEGRRGVQRLVDLEIPIIAAVNGPVSVHSEYALLADVVIASETVVFSDAPHLAFGIAPGDGLFVIWEEVLGLNRARFPRDHRRVVLGPGGAGLGGRRRSRSPAKRPHPSTRTGGADDRPTTADQPLHRSHLPPAHQPPSQRGHGSRHGA